MIEKIYKITQFFYKQHLYRQRLAETDKSRAKAKLQPEASY